MSIFFKKPPPEPLTYSTYPTSAIINLNDLGGSSVPIDIIAVGNGTESLSFSLSGDTSFFSLTSTPSTISGGTTESFTIEYDGGDDGDYPVVTVNIVGSGGNSTSIEITGIFAG